MTLESSTQANFRFNKLNRNETDSPRILELSHEQEQQWQAVHAAMDRYAKGAMRKPFIVRVVRAFNKDPATLRAWMQKVQDEDVLLRCDATILSNPQNEEDLCRGCTVTHLNTALLSSRSQQPPFASVHVEHADGENFWTSAMDGPAAMIAQMAHSLSIDPKNIILHFSSFETEVERSQLSQARSVLDKGEIPLFVRNTPTKHLKNGAKGDVDFQYVRGRAAVLARLISEFIERINSNKVSGIQEIVSTSTLKFQILLSIFACIGRATYGFFRLSDVIESGGFDRQRNKNGGMEDHQQLLQELFAALGRGEDIASLIERMFNGILQYTDTRVTVDTDVNSKKIEAEIQAIQTLILELVQNPDERTTVPADRRDFHFPSPAPEASV